MAADDQDDDDILKEARAAFSRCEDWESHARSNALLDVKFANGDAYNKGQWDQDVMLARNGKPCLTQNKVRQHNLHIINDARQHKAAIKVTPTGGHASFEAAEVFSAIIRRIEYQSKAIDAYATATYHQVESGIGYVRVVTDYVDDDSFDQDIFIRRIKDPLSVYLDPDASEYDKADMRFAFVFTNTPRAEFEAKNPDFGTDTAPAFSADGDWDTKDHVREAEYFRKKLKDDDLLLLADGRTVRASALPPGAREKLPVVRTRKVSEPEIEWYRIAGTKIVERKIWPGRYIPIVPFIGEETVIDGLMDRKGHTRALIDAQKTYNYWSSAAVEQVALQGKTPYMAPVRAIQGYENYWNNANTVNFPYLPYHDVDERGPIARPERSPPPQMAQAYIQGIQISANDMMMVSGQYQAEMGAPGNERSGVAIQQRQREGDTATYHYIDNQAKGIRQVGRICLDLITKIYDVARVTKIMALDGTQSDVHVDPQAGLAHQTVMPPTQPGQPPMPLSAEQAEQAENDPDSPDPHIIFNPNVGRYDVEADVGPAFGTMREEAFNAYSQIIQSSPDLIHVAGDLMFKAADFPMADELADRLKRGVPPQYLGGPSPQVQQLQQQLQAAAQHGQTIAQQADAQVAQLKAHIVQLEEQAKDKSDKTTTDDYRAETDRLNAVTAADPTAAKVLVRSMLSQLLGMPALPIMHAHDAADAAHAQAIAPPDPDAAGGMNGAAA